MTKEMFTEMVIQQIKKYLPDEWKDAEIQRHEKQKVNHVQNSLVFIKNPEQKGGMSPDVSMDYWYEKYFDGDTLDEILEELSEFVLYADELGKPIYPEIDYTKIKEQVVIQLINTMENEEYLKTLPHREIHDLSIVYLWVVDEDPDRGIYSARISNHLAQREGLSEEELYQAAMANTERMLPTIIKPMDEVINELMGKEQPEITEDIIPVEEPMMYVATNRLRSYGANAMLFPDKLQELAEQLGRNFYLLPSSIHELIAIPEDVAELSHLEEMVYEINTTMLDVSERLSNEVYYYDSQTREVTLATDVPDKKLSQGKAEPVLVREESLGR